MSTIFNELNKLSFIIAPVFYKLLFMSIAALCIGVVILLIRRFADDNISPAWKYAMWIVVLVALAVPYRPQTEFSLLNNVAKVQEISYRNEYDQIRGEQHDFVNIEKPTPEQQAAFTNLQKEVQTVFLKSLIFDVAIPLLWLLGVVSIALFMLISRIRLSFKLRQHKHQTSPQHITLLQECKAAIGMKCDSQLFTQDYIDSPALLGLVRPKIILPLYINEMKNESVKYILLHELSHYKRFDMLINYLLLVLQAVYWFNPFVWIMFNFIRQDMELANDNYVINRVGNENSKDYLRSLVEVLSRYSNVSFVPKLLCMVDGKDNMERRIKMIKLGEAFKKRRVIISIASLVLICVMSVLFLTSAYVGSKDVPDMYAHIVSFSAKLKTGTYSWNYGDRSVESDSLVYYEMDYSDGGTLKFQPQNTPLTAYISTQRFTKDSSRRIPFNIVSISRYNPYGAIELIDDYVMDDGDIMINLPNESGIYYYEFVLQFKNGKVYYGLKVIVDDQANVSTNAKDPHWVKPDGPT